MAINLPTSLIWLVPAALIYVAVLIRVLTFVDREPASRAAWIIVLLFLPGVGIVAYLIFGETWIPARLRRKAMAVDANMREAQPVRGLVPVGAVSAPYRPPFMACAHLAGGHITGHNRAWLADDSADAIRRMIEDFDQARATIHVSFYIWLTDDSGCRVADALCRAARRGVTCRVIVDAFGSRALVRSAAWKAMREAGVLTSVSMPVPRGLMALFGARIDLRNHRKIVVVDNRVSWCGSQNCADAAFRIKARYAPWVDIMLRFEGPVAWQNQRLFISDWLVESAEQEPPGTAPQAEPIAGGFPAVAFGTGPVSHQNAMSATFASLLYSATEEVVITNPYFVPDPTLLNAITACSRRGVNVWLVLPARNDSHLVSLISKAHYPQLLDAGVRIFEYAGGLLHAKTLVVDRQLALIGSANMDRRSLDLNFENNLLLHDPATAAAIRQRQDEWLQDAHEVQAEFVMGRPLLRKVIKNLATIFSPIM